MRERDNIEAICRRIQCVCALILFSALAAMGIEFTKAPRWEVGELPSAEKFKLLALAFNDRERPGLGDFHKRGFSYEANAWRQVRNPDETGTLYPSQGEWWEFFANIDPRNTGAAYWPPNGPGEPEGANVVSPFMAWNFGLEQADFPGEQGRISEPAFQLWLSSHPPANNEEAWELGKYQRGVIEPTTGDQNSPAIRAARAAQFISFTGLRTPHGQGNLGFIPTPLQVMSACGSTVEDGSDIPSYQIKFTALRDDVDTSGLHGTFAGGELTYNGSCPSWTEFAAAGDVQNVIREPGYFIVVVFTGTGFAFDVLPTSDWFEGRYTGEGKIWRYDAGFFSRAVYAFCRQFRGTTEQRNPDTFDIEKIAFDFDAFHSKTYLLAPQIGVDTGDGLEPVYPRASRSAKTSKLNSGTVLRFEDGSLDHAYADGFVMTGMFAKAENLRGSCTLEILDGDKVFQRVTLTEAEPTFLKFLSDSIKPSSLSVRLATVAQFDGSGTIAVEFTEQVDYKPDHWDAYLVLRSSATKGGFEDGNNENFLDGSGTDETDASEIYRRYVTNGCITNFATAGIRDIENFVNANPVYEAARQESLNMARMFRSEEFVSYETDDQHRAVFRFKRFAYGSHGDNKLDLFAGIAPDWRGVSEVVEGVEYVVRSHTGGTIAYGGRKFSHGQRFVATSDSEFSAKGDALVLEYEGIKHDAPRKGWTNEHLLSIDTWPYHPSESSLWKHSAYAGWYFLGNRCARFAPEDRGQMPQDLSNFADLPTYPGTDPLNIHLSPEVPSGYLYYGGLNTGASDDFCKSCQIYRAPYELESVTVEFAANGDDIVKVVLTTGLQRHDSAPADVSSDVSTWSAPYITALRAESYRTDDNALREFMLFRARNVHGSWKTGDSAYGSLIQSNPDNPFGSIFPRFYTTSLIKIPNIDGNLIYEATDTRIAVDELCRMERKLKAWAEGAINGFATVNNICGGGTKPYDFIFEDLLYQANGQTHIGDFGFGHGPQTNTALRPGTFNQIAAAVDLLNMFRIEGVMEFQARGVNYEKLVDIAPTWGGGVCPPTSSITAYVDGASIAPELSSTGSWGPASSFEASSNVHLTPCGPSNTTPNLGLRAEKTEVEYRYIQQTGFENALSPQVAALVQNNNIGIVASMFSTIFNPIKHETGDITAAKHCGPNIFFDGGTGSGWFWTTQEDDIAPSCSILSGGQLSVSNAPSGSLFVCTYPDAGNPIGFSITQNEGSIVTHVDVLSNAGSAIIVVPVVEREVEAA